MAGKIPVQAVGMRQRKPELVVFKVDTSATSAVADTNAGLASSDGFGKNHGTVQKTATGVYSIKLNRVARQMPLVVGWNARTVDARIQCVPQSDFQEIICTCEVNGTNTDMDFEVSLLCLYSDTEY